jgi:hypothetical protein
MKSWVLHKRTVINLQLKYKNYLFFSLLIHGGLQLYQLDDVSDLVDILNFLLNF